MWQFRVLIMGPRLIEGALIALGAKEWELVSLETIVIDDGLVTVCVMRRERV